MSCFSLKFTYLCRNFHRNCIITVNKPILNTLFTVILAIIVNNWYN